MTESRFRINVSQTAKGLHQFDATIEMGTDFIAIHEMDDLASKKELAIGEKLLEILKKTEEVFRKDGRKLVIDNE